MAKAKTDPTPLVDQLRKLQEERRENAIALVHATAKALAEGNQPRGVENIDEALRHLGQDPAFLEELAGLYQPLLALEQLAAEIEPRADELQRLRAEENALIAANTCERDRMLKLEQEARQRTGGAEHLLTIAKRAPLELKNAKRAIVAFVDPEWAEKTRARIKDLSQRIQRNSMSGAASEKLQAMQRELGLLMPSANGSRGSDELQERIAGLEDEIAAEQERLRIAGTLEQERRRLEEALAAI